MSQEIGFSEFRKELAEWKTSQDDDDYCPNCWRKYIRRFRGERRKQEMFNSKATATRSVAENRKSPDGWFVMCTGCGTQVFALPAQEEAKA